MAEDLQEGKAVYSTTGSFEALTHDPGGNRTDGTVNTRTCHFNFLEDVCHPWSGFVFSLRPYVWLIRSNPKDFADLQQVYDRDRIQAAVIEVHALERRQQMCLMELVG